MKVFPVLAIAILILISMFWGSSLITENTALKKEVAEKDAMLSELRKAPLVKTLSFRGEFIPDKQTCSFDFFPELIPKDSSGGLSLAQSRRPYILFENLDQLSTKMIRVSERICQRAQPADVKFNGEGFVITKQTGSISKDEFNGIVQILREEYPDKDVRKH